MLPVPALDLCRRACRSPVTRYGLSAAVLSTGLLFATTGWGLLLAGFLAALIATGQVSAALCRIFLPEAEDTEAPDGQTQLIRALDTALRRPRPGDGRPVAMVIELDDKSDLARRRTPADLRALAQTCLERIDRHLRPGELSVLLNERRFGLQLSGDRRLDLDGAMQIAGHIQRALAEGVELGGQRVQPSASIGFCLAGRMPDEDGEALFRAATLAAIEADRNGPMAIRSYSKALSTRVLARESLSTEVAAALENGQIRAWYQPQVSAVTGAVTGVEALARWQHPCRGLVPPSEFLPAIHQAGLMQSLGTLMVQEALKALTDWDARGLEVPAAGVNFSVEELSDPRLVERIGWELDKHELTPDRLVVEVLETVVARSSEDLVVSNLAALSRLGCHLDLDDFGTGHAAITSIRQLSIGRIKIDRSFVTGIDADIDQQQMVAAILTMAERLGLDTLAEGVETAAEQAQLAKLGCSHLQGFGIARPMPLDEMTNWLERRSAASGEPVPLRRTGS